MGYNHTTGDGDRIFAPIFVDVWDTHLKHMSGSDVKVYVALLLHTTQHDRTWFMSLEELAEDAGVGRDTARRAKDRLIEAGLLQQWWRIRNGEGNYELTDKRPPPRLQAKNLYKINVKPRGLKQAPIGAENKPHVGAENKQQTITPTTQPPTTNPPNPPRGADGAGAAEGEQQPLLPGIPEGQAPTGHQPPAPQPVGQPDLQAEFERWWATCPRKIGKGRWPEGNRKGTGARAAFIRAREQASLQQLMDGMARSVAAWKAEGRAADKLPHPSTWLNQARWEDEGAGEWQQQVPQARNTNTLAAWLGTDNAPQPRNTNTLAAWLGTDTAPQVGQQGHQPGPVIEHNEGNTPWL